MRHRQALVHGQALDLVEDGGVGGVELVGAEDLAGTGHVERGLLLEHDAGLDRGGVGAQHDVGSLPLSGPDAGAVDVEGVLHLAGGVVGVEVEGVEVEPLVLDLRPLGDGPAHGGEEVADLVDEHVEGVPGTGLRARGGDGDIDGLGAQHLLLGGGLEGLLPGGQSLGDAPASAAQELAGGGLVRLVQGADEPVGQGQGRGVAGVGQAGLLELGEGAGCGEGGQGLLDGGVDAVLVQGRERAGSVSHIAVPSTRCLRGCPPLRVVRAVAWV